MKHERLIDTQSSVKATSSSVVPGLTDNYIIAIAMLMVVLAELLMYAGNIRAGIVMHVITLLTLSVSAIWIDGSHVSRSLQVLSLLPILRLLNVSMPVFSDMTLYLYIYVYTPLLVPIYFIIRHQHITKRTLGIHFRDMQKYLPLSVAVGFIIAQGEYLTINAGNLVPDLSFVSILKLSIVMIFFVGFLEELIFRSLLQTRLSDSFGHVKGLLLASLLFGVMHSGYGTIYEIFFTSFAGLVIGYMFQRTNSLPLVTLTHGFVNVFLFGIIPLLS
ncbi:CPBP family intramembrane glutamic endopeptidase [Methanolobus psychrotolerans]|uniref:CPBP family intramembrane glutamic endopeptidase n=1 Tax=Methanolobus psychrotolerans TaxID=1874706 RepID=UPI000B916D41|nr:CPBP family intramembrane glutamic endopeptidase [Methanolobus psychrotolerans]